MNDYDKKPLLKQAVAGYVSFVIYLKELNLKSSLRKFFLVAEIYKSLLLYAVKASGKSFVSVLFTAFGKADFVRDLSILLSVSQTQEEDIRAIFNQYGIDVSFLSKHGISLLAFTAFVIHLAERIERKQKSGMMPENIPQQKEVIMSEAVTLIQTHYVQFECVVCYMTEFVDQVGSCARLILLARQLQTVYCCQVVEADELEAVSIKESFWFQRTTQSVVLSEVHRLEKGSQNIIEE